MTGPCHGSFDGGDGEGAVLVPTSIVVILVHRLILKPSLGAPDAT